MHYLLSALLVLCYSVTVVAESARVKVVVDGDTFITTDGEKVRMLGINATEREEWFYREAKDQLQQRIKGKEVELIADSKSPNRDKHGRLLRYVHLGETDVNREMILSGHAYAFLRYKIDRKAQYAAAERQARKAKVGLWGDDRPQETNDPTTVQDRSFESPAYLLVAITVFITLVIAIQMWRYFR